MVINGRSAGGLLMGAVTNMAPDMMKAVVAGEQIDTEAGFISHVRMFFSFSHNNICILESSFQLPYS